MGIRKPCQIPSHNHYVQQKAKPNLPRSCIFDGYIVPLQEWASPVMDTIVLLTQHKINIPLSPTIFFSSRMWCNVWFDDLWADGTGIYLDSSLYYFCGHPILSFRKVILYFPEDRVSSAVQWPQEIPETPVLWKLLYWKQKLVF